MKTVEEIARMAYEYNHDRGYMCSEAVVHAMNDGMELGLPDELLAASSSFGGGMSSGCACGALVGGQIVLGALKGRTSPAEGAAGVRASARELHDFFKETNKSTCCRVLTRGGKDRERCASLTRSVVEKVSQMVAADGK
ncbi:MAG: C-GCAxxG-C-C family protein [Rikenellaceae bacterium]|nr:C-GCAxxG-C-C family protein [Rikenellaceae bacterium]